MIGTSALCHVTNALCHSRTQILHFQPQENSSGRPHTVKCLIPKTQQRYLSPMCCNLFIRGCSNTVCNDPALSRRTGSTCQGHCWPHSTASRVSYTAALIYLVTMKACSPARFESAAKRWDAENDIVLLAKEMCMMMMDMSDFTRYSGYCWAQNSEGKAASTDMVLHS